MASSATFPSISCFSSSLFLNSYHQIPKTLFSTFNPIISLKPLKPLPSHTHLQTFRILCHLTASTLPILSVSGSKVGEAILTLKTAPMETSRSVVHRGIITDLNNKRRGTASTLTRGEVRGGGKKPYPQKKTGRARRGSQRTPLRRGGGVIFGPKPKDWTVKINKKEKRLAISTALSSAAMNAIVVEDFGSEFERPKTTEFIELIRRWEIDPKENSMFLLMVAVDNVILSSRNIGTVKMLTPRTLNLFDVLNADKLVFTKDAVDYLNKMYGYDYDGEGEQEEEEEFEEGNEGIVEDITSKVME